MRIILYIAMIIASVVLLALAVIDLLDLADVYVGDITGKCVRVELADGSAGDCSKLPRKYNRYIVPEK